MIKVYINYPVPHITIHSDPGCGTIQMQKKENQRLCLINSATLSSELKKFQENRYRFTANQQYNDMWLEIKLADKTAEIEVVERICHLLGKHYAPFSGVKPNQHC